LAETESTKCIPRKMSDALPQVRITRGVATTTLMQETIGRGRRRITAKPPSEAMLGKRRGLKTDRPTAEAGLWKTSRVEVARTPGKNRKDTNKVGSQKEGPRLTSAHEELTSDREGPDCQFKGRERKC